MKAKKDIYQAIADPTRRQIIDLIVKQSQNVNSIAEHFDMTRQAVSLHVNILVDAGLVVITQNGRERLCEVQLEQLTEVVSWIEQSRMLWLKRFDKLNKYLQDQQKKNNAKK